MSRTVLSGPLAIASVGRAAAVIITLLAPTYSAASLQLLAVSGDAQPGVAGSQLQSIAAPALNESGQVALIATLKTGLGGVTTSNNVALWRIDGGAKQSVARTGVGSAPGASADGFTSLQNVLIDDAGAVALSATLQSDKHGVWKYPSTTGSLVALTNSSAAPGVANAKFEALIGGLVQSSTGSIAVNAKMVGGLGGVVSTNDRGVWLYDGGSSTLVTREGITPAPGVPSGTFATPTAVALNRQGQIAAIASLQTINEITSQNALGIWRLTAGGGDLVARQTVGEVGGVPTQRSAA
jgi:hypothetical protein